MLNNDFFFPVAVGGVVAFIATGVGVVRYGGLPRWLGWIAIVIGVLCGTPAGFFALLAALVWIGVASVLLFRGAGAAAVAGAAR